MSDTRNIEDSQATPSDRIGHLVRLAGRRPMPDSTQMATARAAARAAWTRAVERRRWRWSVWTFTSAALATGAVAGLAIGLWFASARQPTAGPGPLPVAGVEIGTLQTVTGSVSVTTVDPRQSQPREQPRRAAAGTALHPGDRLATVDRSRAACTLRGGLSLRLDHNTTLALNTPDRLTLERGAVYIDAAPGQDHARLRVDTPFGGVEHIGTQFEVRLQADGVRVRVREGAVAIEHAGARETMKAGEGILLTRDRDHAVTREKIATFGPEWSWLDALAPPFQVEGAHLSRFLDWASREQGLRWEYAKTDRALARRIERTVLHGSVQGLTPEEAIAAVLPTCGLTARRDHDRLIISAW